MRGRSCRRSVIRSLLVPTTLVFGLFVNETDVARAAATFSLAVQYASGTSVSPGAKVDLIAEMPVVQQGTVTQEIVQTIDPTKLKLTAATDITYPNGWTLSVSFNGTSFTPSLPASATGSATSWDKVVKVKASGPIVSQGESNGYQIAEGTASGSAVSTAPAFIASSGTGDGFEAFFDPGRTRVFNLYHHEQTYLPSSAYYSLTPATLDCHVLADGSTCAGFPWKTRIGTNHVALGKVVGDKLWLTGSWNDPSDSPDGGWQVGFECIDLSAVIATGGNPKDCPKPWIPMGSFNMAAFDNSVNPNNYNTTIDLVGSSYAGSSTSARLWTMNAQTGALYCLDTATTAACAGMPSGGWTIAWPGGLTAARPTSFSWYYLDTSIEIWGGRIYMKAWAATPADWRATCVLESDPTQSCPGFSGATSGATSGQFRAVGVGKLVQLPAADGTIRGVCLVSTSPYCFNSSGATFTFPSSFTMSTYYQYGPHPTRAGTRIYLSDGGTTIYCWDASLASGAGAGCFGGQGSLAANTLSQSASSAYTFVPDPLVPDCGWVGYHPQPTLRTINLKTGSYGTQAAPACNSLAPKRIMFSGSPVIPRMACGVTGNAIRSWRTFTLTSPSTGFTSATLTVQDSLGGSIVGWTDVPLTPNSALDLSTLSVATSGQNPKFAVDITGGAGVSTGSATISAVGDAPQLCLSATAVLTCPAMGSGLGYVTGLPAATSSAVSASGTAVDGSNNSTAVGPDSKTVNIGAPAADSCGGQVRGTAVFTGTATGVTGVTVNLLDASGNPVLDGSGSPITTTTAADGTYSFGNLKPGSYKVSFGTNSGTAASATQYTDTGAGAAGTNTANATSSTIVVVATQTDVINTTYPTVLVATNDATSGAKGAVQTKDLTSNDIAGTGNTLTKSSVYLCDSGQTDAACKVAAARTKSVAGVGVYSVNATTGVMTFTPDANYTGTPPAVKYVISDSGGGTTSATYTPTVVDVPTAGPDTSSAAFGVTQTRNLLSNDAAASGATLTASSVRLCGTGETAPNCTQTSVTRSEGTYSVSNGTVTFVPASGYSGTPASPIAYTVTDSLDQKASSTYAPTVSPPTAPTATPDVRTVVPGGSVSFTKVVGSGGLASGTGLKTGASGGPCLVASPSTTPSSGCVTSLTTTDGSWVIDQTTGVAVFTANPNVSPGNLIGVDYRVTDAAGQTASATLTPVAPARPTAAPDTSVGAYGATQTKDLLPNDSTDAVTSFSASSVRLCGAGDTAPNCTQTAVTRPEGAYSLSSGTVTFVPAAGFVGTPSSPIVYSVTDALGQKASSTYAPTVAPLSLPVAQFDASTGLKGVVQSINPLANDSADPAVNLAASSVKLCGTGETAPACTKTTLTNSAGTYSVDPATGVISFNPGASFTGVAPAVSYQVADTVGAVASSTYTATVYGPPSASSDTTTGTYGATQSRDLLANDAADPLLALVASSVRLCGAGETAPTCTQTSLTRPEGTYSLAADRVTFTPAFGYTGTPSTPVTYTVADSSGQSASSTYTPSVTPPAEPVAKPDRKPVVAGKSAKFVAILGSNGLASGTGLKTGASGGPRFVCPVTAATECSASAVSVPGEGIWSIDQSTGVVTFAPVAGLSKSGDLTSVAYMVTDEAGQTATAKLTPYVVPPPTAYSDASTGEQGKSQTLSPLGNDVTGNASTSFDPSTLRLCEPGTKSDCSLTTLVVRGEGRYVVNPNGTISFTPEEGFAGKATVLSYEIADRLGQIASSSIRVTVVPPPYPTGLPDTLTGPPGSKLIFSPWRNDSPGTKPGDTLEPDPNLVPRTLRLCGPRESVPTCTATSLSTPDGVYVVDISTGQVKFTPTAGFTGVATQPVTYQIANDWTGSAGVGFATSVLIPTINAEVTNAGNSTVPTRSGSSTSVRNAHVLPVTGQSTKKMIQLALIFIVVGAVFVVRHRFERLK